MISGGISNSCKNLKRQSIKIRKVRVLERKTRTFEESIEKNTGNHEFHGKNLIRSSSEFGDMHVSEKMIWNTSQNAISTREIISKIQKIEEKSEIEEDSLIYELNELLSPKIIEKTHKIVSKTPRINNLAGLKIRVKTEIPMIKTERVIPRSLKKSMGIIKEKSKLLNIN